MFPLWENMLTSHRRCGMFPIWDQGGEMRIIAKRTIAEFGTKNPSARASLDHWLNVTQGAEWASTNDVQLTFTKAKVLNAERVRFEVAGGDFRMICAFDFRRKIVFVKFIGTHNEYDRVDAITVSQF